MRFFKKGVSATSSAVSLNQDVHILYILVSNLNQVCWVSLRWICFNSLPWKLERWKVQPVRAELHSKRNVVFRFGPCCHCSPSYSSVKTTSSLYASQAYCCPLQVIKTHSCWGHGQREPESENSRLSRIYICHQKELQISSALFTCIQMFLLWEEFTFWLIIRNACSYISN